MERALENVALGVVCCVIVAGGGFAGLAMAAGDMDKDSLAFSQSAVQAITANWSASELISRGAPNIANAPPQPIKAMFDKVRTFGAPVNQGCRGGTLIKMPFGRALEVSARYACQMASPKGPETIDLVLLRDPQGDWKITGFHVDSPLFLQSAKS